MVNIALFGDLEPEELESGTVWVCDDPELLSHADDRMGRAVACALE
jgi:hypothetical protein